MVEAGDRCGDWVRMVDVDAVSRELCGGTHVATTAEVGLFHVTHETSSASNVRRIEALTGPAAIEWYRDRRRRLEEAGALLGSPRDPVAGARRAAERVAQLEETARVASTREAGEVARELAEREGTQLDGLAVIVARAEESDQKRLLELADRVKSLAGDSAVVLGGADGGKVGLVAAFTDAAVERGLSAADVVREAAAVVGGGGGGRPNVAQAGGRDASRLDDALEAARRAIEHALAP